MAIRRKIRSIDLSFEVLTLRNRLLQSFVCAGVGGVIGRRRDGCEDDSIYRSSAHKSVYHKTHKTSQEESGLGRGAPYARLGCSYSCRAMGPSDAALLSASPVKPVPQERGGEGYDADLWLAASRWPLIGSNGDAGVVRSSNCLRARCGASAPMTARGADGSREYCARRG